MRVLLLFVSFLMFLQLDKKGLIYKFDEMENISNWTVVDDRVMGGQSRGNIHLNEEGNGLYTGIVSTENNGGFSSVRLQFYKKNVSQYNAVLLKLKGDQKNYQFRIKSSADQEYSYVSTFKTNGEWEEIRIPFNQFKPQYRGRSLDKPNYSGEQMEEITFLIGNKNNEIFQLEIDYITLIK